MPGINCVMFYVDSLGSVTIPRERDYSQRTGGYTLTMHMRTGANKTHDIRVTSYNDS